MSIEKPIYSSVLIPLILCIFLQISFAQDTPSVYPLTLGYQGYLVDEGQQPFDGERTVTFKLYDSPWPRKHEWQEEIESVRVFKWNFTRQSRTKDTTIGLT